MIISVTNRKQSFTHVPITYCSQIHIQYNKNSTQLLRRFVFIVNWLLMYVHRAENSDGLHLFTHQRDIALYSRLKKKKRRRRRRKYQHNQAYTWECNFCCMRSFSRSLEWNISCWRMAIWIFILTTSSRNATRDFFIFINGAVNEIW